MVDKWWEKKKEAATIWQACKTPDGYDYYFNTESNETSWDKPDELMTEEEKVASGDWRWVPDETACFLPGKRLRDLGTKSVLRMEDGTERTILNKVLEPLKKSSLLRDTDDLVLLDRFESPPLFLVFVACLSRFHT